MDNQDPPRRKEEEIDHSLPGTNQAGKGAATGPEDEPDRGSDDMTRQEVKHSLPGTNQAGKGADPGEESK